MAESSIARGQAVHRKSDRLRRLVRDAKRAQDRAQRPHPTQRIRAHGGRAPAHGFGPGKRANDRGNDLRDQLARRAAGLLDDGDIELALLAVGNDFCVPDASQSRALEEALNGGFGRADARPLALLAPMRLRLGQADDMQGEPARRRKRLRAFIEDIGVDQRAGDEPLQILRRLPLHARGNFFAEEFEQEIGHRESLDRFSLAPSPLAGEGGPKGRMRGRRGRPAL